MKFVPNALGQRLGRASLHLDKASPQVLFVGGVVGMVGSTVLACRATLKMNELLEETQNNLSVAKSMEHQQYSEQDRRRDISLIYFQSGVKTVKLYAPAIIVGGLSIAALTRSHRVLTERNVALTAAYAAIEKGFGEYRARVIEKYGEEQDRDFRYGYREEKIKDEATGKTKTVKRAGLHTPSIYARFFDETCAGWSPEPEYNRLFLNCKQNYLNDRLHSRGHVFLNEVYDELGMERSQAGAVVGWILSHDGSTDNYIDFGTYNSDNAAARQFVNGLEGSILLDFNVDGLIWDKLND